MDTRCPGPAGEVKPLCSDEACPADPAIVAVLQLEYLALLGVDLSAIDLHDLSRRPYNLGESERLEERQRRGRHWITLRGNKEMRRTCLTKAFSECGA